MQIRKPRHAIAVLQAGCVGLLLAGCQSIPPEALSWTPTSLEQRQLQSRSYDVSDEGQLLSASAQVLQDLGFNLDESEVDLGLLVASKDRDATEAGQVIGAIFVGALFGVYVPVDDEQRIRVSVVSRPGLDSRMHLRVTFQRVVWNTDGNVSRSELLEDPELYREFFDALDQSLFLTSNEI